MENTATEIIEPKTFGIQISITIELGGKLHRHSLIPTMMTEEELDKQVEHYSDYEEWNGVQYDCISEYGDIYILVLGKEMLKRSYFEFRRVNIVPVGEE